MKGEVLADIVEVTGAKAAGVAVVDCSGVVFQASYGCDEHVGFPIGSTTKAMNAALIGLLVGEGIFGWDNPVCKYGLTLDFADAYATRHVTLRDLVCMRTGLPRHDWVWRECDLTRSQIAERLPHLPLTAGFRERFQYSNLTPTLAAHVVESVMERSWESLLRERILEPLGMGRTTFGPGQRPTVGCYQVTGSGEVRAVDARLYEATAPAGSLVHSTLADMALWLQAQLSAPAAAHAPQVGAGTDPAAPGPFGAYGLGWFVDTAFGHRRVSHSGFINGVASDLILFPDASLALVAFGAGCAFPIVRLMTDAVCDQLFDHQVFRPVRGVVEQLKARFASAPPPCSRRPPSRPLEAHVGLFGHPAYGSFEVGAEEGGLVLSRRGFRVRLDHRGDGVWTARSDLLVPPSGFEHATPIAFVWDGPGAAVALLLRLEPGLPAFRFPRTTFSPSQMRLPSAPPL